MLEVVCLSHTLGLFKYRFITLKNPFELKDINFLWKLTANTSSYIRSGFQVKIQFGGKTVCS